VMEHWVSFNVRYHQAIITLDISLVVYT